MDIVSTIVNHSIDSKFYSGHNPTKLVSKLKVDNKRERILTKSEVEDVLDAVAENWILNLFVRISLSTAARKGTVLNIKKCDVNLPFGKIAFNVAIHDQQIHKHGEVNYKKSMLVLTSTKKLSE